MESGSPPPQRSDVDAAIAAVRDEHVSASRRTEEREQVHQAARSIADHVHGRPGITEQLVTAWDARRTAATITFVAIMVVTLGLPLLGFVRGWAAAALVALFLVTLLTVAAVQRAGSPPREARRATTGAAVLLLDGGCTPGTATEAMLRAEADHLDPQAVAVAIRDRVR